MYLQRKRNYIEKLKLKQDKNITTLDFIKNKLNLIIFSVEVIMKKMFRIFVISFSVLCFPYVSAIPNTGVGMEIETKILEVDPSEIARSLDKIGAKKTEDTLLSVDWLKFSNTSSPQQEWYLRIRSYKDTKVEITWKGKSQVHGVSRTSSEGERTLIENEYGLNWSEMRFSK